MKREQLGFLADNPLDTKRFAYYVGWRCHDATIKDVATELGPTGAPSVKEKMLMKLVHDCSAIAAIGIMLIAFASSANGKQPPGESCRVASKIEYDSAKRSSLLSNRFGRYVRTGRVWRRQYWYCA